MIVDAFTESLELGLESPGQVVVSADPALTLFGANVAYARGVGPCNCSL